MDALDLARWQFGITTVYHFLFVPITLGMSMLVAILHTAWHRTGNEQWLKLTKFFGKLFLINFAIGVATGIVQEFQFGMNWSSYSRFVGDIFGAPLAVEALLAFFLESTFLGIWIFGWGRVPRRIHLAAIWLAAIGTWLSAYFILAANSFMQNPVGYLYNPETGRAEMTDFLAVLTNKVTLVTFPHTITAAIMTSGAIMLAVAVWHLAKGSERDAGAFRKAFTVGLVATVIGGVGVMGTGDLQGKIMTDVQPMKMAAAEGLYETQAPAEFSLLTIGTWDGDEEVFSVTVPKVLSFLATGDWEGEVKGINNLQEEYQEKYGAGDYRPNIPVTYWTFRLMIITGLIALAISAWAWWQGRRGGFANRRLLLAAVTVLPLLPLIANSFGWIFTEMGRQPWAVFGLLPTAAGVSPQVSALTVAISLIGFTVIYAVLGVIEVKLFLRYARAGLPDVSRETDDEHTDSPDRPLTFAY